MNLSLKGGRLTNGATLVGLLTVPDPGDHVVRVAEHLPDQELHSEGPQEAKYPVVDLLSSPEEMEEMTQRHHVDVVAVQQPLLLLRSVILPGRSNLISISQPGSLLVDWSQH